MSNTNRPAPPPKAESNFKREPIPAGVHGGVITEVYMPASTPHWFGGELKGFKEKVFITIDFPSLPYNYEFKDKKTEQMVQVNSTMQKTLKLSYSFSEKAHLVRHIKSIFAGKRKFTDEDWNPNNQKCFNVFDLVGQKVLATVTHNANKKDASVIYDNINTLSPLPDAMAATTVSKKTQWSFYFTDIQSAKQLKERDGFEKVSKSSLRSWGKSEEFKFIAEDKQTTVEELLSKVLQLHEQVVLAAKADSPPLKPTENLVTPPSNSDSEGAGSNSNPEIPDLDDIEDLPF